jgi:hypothetical protein
MGAAEEQRGHECGYLVAAPSHHSLPFCSIFSHSEASGLPGPIPRSRKAPADVHDIVDVTCSARALMERPDLFCQDLVQQVAENAGKRLARTQPRA